MRLLRGDNVVCYFRNYGLTNNGRRTGNARVLMRASFPNPNHDFGLPTRVIRIIVPSHILRRLFLESNNTSRRKFEVTSATISSYLYKVRSHTKQ